MLNVWVLFAVSAAYVGALFAIAYVGDQRAASGRPFPGQSWIYSLALGVYCTSWTFYGAVGRAASSGWDFLPIYLGPILVFVFGTPLIGRIIAISKRQNITSIADFIGARYGRHQPLSMLVTVIAVIGVLPYIALQLKAVAFSFDVLAAPDPLQSGLGVDNALVMAALLAMFSILFGTRQVVSSENHHGMVLAIAFESVIKLVAFLAIGIYAVFGLYQGFGDAYAHALALPQVTRNFEDGRWLMGFASQTLLAMAAIICLPRQFHVTVVESTSPGDVKTARWVFPIYLALISLFVLPIAAAGLQHLPAGVLADTFVLALPMNGQHGGLALVAYLGGFSAATSMVIVATIALSTMLCNEVVMPVLLRWRSLGLERRQDLSSLLKAIRRAAIVGIVVLAYLYYRYFTGPGTLASIGLLSFAAVLQFTPALIGGLYWRRGAYPGAVAGISIGFAVWFYTLLLPTLLPSPADAGWLAHGPLGIAALRPQALFGLAGLDPVTHSTIWSLAANILAYVLGSLIATPGLHERLQAARFLGLDHMAPPPPGPAPKLSATVGDLQELIERFFGVERAGEIFAALPHGSGGVARSSKDRAEPALVRHTEHLLAGTLGTASARLVLASALRGRDMQLEDVIHLLDETSHVIQFNRELLRAALEHLSQGVSVVDNELRLVAWNRRYTELFEYPPTLVSVGRPIEDLFRYNAGRGLLGAGAPEELVSRRLEHLRRGNPYTHEREFPNGTVIEIRGTPMPGGGFVTSYSDVTAYKRTERALQESNETLETRVAERTRELTGLNHALAQAKGDADRANEAKTRFLAAASHDLVQPLNAARLFVSSLDQRALDAPAQTIITQVESSLTSAETLISSLLDISRLDARGQEMRLEHFALRDILQPLAAEFAALARERGLALRFVPATAVVHSDPMLLRRVVQNFLSNAVRYTRSGRVLLGCRRTGGGVRIEVWDTGPGIPAASQGVIFEEFRRLVPDDARGERGLGLGLAIAERISRMLGHPLSLRSEPGRGSVFAIEVPLGDRNLLKAPRANPARSSDRVAGALVLCLENEPAVLAAMRAQLESWQCRVIPARSAQEAQAHFAATGEIPDLMLVDYHLDAGQDGVRAASTLTALWKVEVPGIVITADHTREAKAAAAEHGYALLPKPVKPAALRGLMSRMLMQRGAPPHSS